ncbi:hypothetical protein EYF80_019193 [Liparis tanakae]|uniref:Uncharacterized protein n=1 Tax=Liparis tanakae TaxID=230148 RepID=A0A4Z2HXP0_9TELE|nr:hypothetical protein EYF80_019193 [Liparis tanakae]
MHQVLPEKEVSPLVSARKISLLETGTELNPALTDWWIERGFPCLHATLRRHLILLAAFPSCSTVSSVEAQI